MKTLLRRLDVIAFRRSTGLFLPEDEMPLLVRRLCDKPEPLVVDGGAHRGDFVRAIKKQLPNARFVCFEPDEDLIHELQRDFAGDDRVTVVAAALGNRSGTAQFNLNRSRATNSLLPSTGQNAGALRDLVATQSTVVVDVTTVDEALAKASETGADIIKLDLQGYDLLALQGAARTLERTAVVVVEVWFAPIYEGAPDYLQVCTWMAERGFALYALTGLHYGAFDRLLWGDAVFVPRTSTAWRTPISH